MYRRMNLLMLLNTILYHLYIAQSLIDFQPTLAVIIDKSIAKSNIYYQEPLQKGLPHELLLDEVTNLTSKEDFKLIIHGYLANRNHSSISPLKQAYMSQGRNNILLADWYEAAQTDYFSARNSVQKVSIVFAQILEKFINRHNVAMHEIHVIGHSLGAHIAGGIGRYFNGTLGRVTGLDPALPLFTPNVNDGLQASAGQFVDVIHTDYPIFGDITPRGTVDFYPNYGHTGQKGCEEFDLISASKLLFRAYSCSHNRAVLLYAESINIPLNFPSIPCSLFGIKSHNVGICYQELLQNNLTPLSLRQAIAEKNDSIVVYMGENVSKRASGIYYLETNAVPPYGYGLFTQIV